jgi:hypothetical protein
MGVPRRRLRPLSSVKLGSALMETEPNGVAVHCRPTATATVYAAFVLDLLSIGWHVEDGHGRALRIAKLHSNGVHLISLPPVASPWSLNDVDSGVTAGDEPAGETVYALSAGVENSRVSSPRTLPP